MMGSGVTLELARLAPRRQTPLTWNRVFSSNQELVDKLCSKDVLLDARKFAVFETGEGQGLCSCLDTDISLCDLQLLRLFGECDYSWKAIESLCKVAYESESLYRWVSRGQWLRTVSEAHPRRAEQLVFRSNVVPRGEYLRVASANTVHCAAQGCTEGFFRVGEGDPRSRQCRGKCNLAERLNETGAVDEEDEARSANELLPPLEESPDFVKRLGAETGGTYVSIISYRKGLFAKKQFWREETGPANPTFVKELEVAKRVLHPNIVHCFSSAEKECDFDQAHYSCLVMELLQNDLEGVLLDLARIEECFSFRDSLLVLLQIARAMKRLHDRNFVHGDLKTGNIFVSRLAMSHAGVDNRFHLIKVGDFGCAQRVEPSDIYQYFDFRIGSACYTAPEVWALRRQPQPVLVQVSPDLQKLDVYSFGVVAYQVLTGLPSTDMGTKPGRSFSKDAVMKPDGDPGQWRPSCDFDGALIGDDRSVLLPLVTKCWSSSPQNRPDFSSICVELQSLFDERFPSNPKEVEDHHAKPGIFAWGRPGAWRRAGRGLGRNTLGRDMEVVGTRRQIALRRAKDNRKGLLMDVLCHWRFYMLVVFILYVISNCMYWMLQVLL